MPEATLQVTLIEVTKNPLAMIYAAARQCYSSEFAADIFAVCKRKAKGEKVPQFVKKIVASGHESPLEHVKFTFAVQGVSRVLTHQLVRHRLASYSQQSQRYIKEEHFDYIIPPRMKKKKELRDKFERLMLDIQELYNYFLACEKSTKKEEVLQDARFVLPNATETKIVVTMNARELIHFFHERTCARAQWEIKALAEEMLRICKGKLAEVFGTAGPKCTNLGYCPEGSQFTCGRYPTKEKALKK
jgi:thymidylate synthase (FAD)